MNLLAELWKEGADPNDRYQFAIIKNGNINDAEIGNIDSIDLTHEGQIMILSTPVMPSALHDYGFDSSDAYNTKFRSEQMLISKTEARNIIGMLNKAIKDNYHAEYPLSRENLIPIFGENAVSSYMRLIDRLRGMCYPLYNYESYAGDDEQNVDD